MEVLDPHPQQTTSMTSPLQAGNVDYRTDHLSLAANLTVIPVFTKLASAVFVLVLGLFVAARLWRLTAYSLRADEIFSLQAARHDWSGLLALVVNDVVHPPLFYLLLKAWISIGGESQFWLRLFPVLTSVAAICPFFLLCRELKLRAAETNVALTLVAVNGYMIYYSQELRMYSLLLFLTLCSLWLFVRFLNAKNSSNKYLLSLFAANLLLVYTQYYGWLIVGVEFIFLLIWKSSKLSAFSLSVAALALCSSPWAYFVTRVAAGRGGLGPNIGSFQRPNLIDLVGYYAILCGPLHPRWKTLLGLVLFGFPVLLWARRVQKTTPGIKNGQIATFSWLLIFSFVPVVFSYAVSQVLPQSVWGTRFMIIVAAPFMILITLAVFRLNPGWVRCATVLLVAAWAMLAGLQELNNSGKNAWEPLVHQMIAAEASQSDSIAVYSFESMDETIRFYLSEAREKRFQPKRVRYVTEMQGDRFWVALRESTEGSAQRELMDSGYQIGEGFRDGFDGLLFPVWRR